MARPFVNFFFWAILIAVIANSGFGSSSLRDPFRVVAVQGRTAPGTLADTFSSLFSPAINDKGQVAFAGFATGGDGVRRLGIWSEGSGVLGVAALHELEPSGVSFELPTNQIHFAFNNRGETVWRNGGIWLNRNGTTELAVGVGVPVMVDGQSVILEAPSRPVINHDGQLAFLAIQDNVEGLYIGSNGQFHKLLDNRSPVAGTPLFPGINLLAPPAINSSGNFALWGGNFNGGISTNTRGANEFAAQSWRHGYSEPEFSSVYAPIITSTGDVVFTGWLGGDGVTPDNSESLWLFGSNGLQMLAREGDQAPGMPSGVVFSSFSVDGLATRAVSDEHGNIAFAATVRGPGINRGNDQSLWRAVGGQLELVVHAGTPAPGISSGLEFHMFEAPVLNGHGQLAFKARLHGTAKYGIWAEDRRGVLQLIAHEGHLIDLDSGAGADIRTINDVHLASYYPATAGMTYYRARGEGDQPYSINDRGQIAFAADFGDGTRAILISNAIAVPENANLTVVVAGLLIVISRTRGCAQSIHASFS